MPFRSGSPDPHIAADKSWAHTIDRDARTAPGLQAARQKLEDAVDPDRKMTPETRRKAIKNAQRARMRELSKLGVAARQRKRAAAKRRAGAP